MIKMFGLIRGGGIAIIIIFGDVSLGVSRQTDKQSAGASGCNQRVLSWSKAYFYTIKVLITNQLPAPFFSAVCGGVVSLRISEKIITA